MKHILLTLITIAVLTAARPAMAQGTSGQLPDPMNRAELMRYADHLGLSETQRLAAGALHQTYLASFRELRDGRIEAFMNDATMAGGGIPEKEALDRYMREFRALMDRIGRLDNAVFDQLSAVLNEEQLVRLERVRKRRERARYNTQFAAMAALANPGANVDLSTLWEKLELDPGSFELGDPIIAQYEGRYTSLTKKNFLSAIEMPQRMIEGLEASGIDLEAMQENPAEAMTPEVMQSMQQIWADVLASISESAVKMEAMNESTLRQLIGVLPAIDGQRMRYAYYGAAHPMAVNAVAPAIQQIDRIARNERLTDDERAAVIDLRGRYVARVEPLVQEMIEVGTEMRAQQVRGFDSDVQAESMQRIQDVMSQQGEAVAWVNSELGGLFGAERMATLGAIAEPGMPGGPADLAASAEIEVTEDPAGMGSGFVPGAISSREIRRYGRLLGLDEGDQMVLEGLHEDYRAKYDILNNEVLRDARRDLQTWGQGYGGFGRSEEEQSAEPASAKIDEAYAKARAALAAIRVLDTEFMLDLAVAFPDAIEGGGIERVRSARLHHLSRDVVQEGRASIFAVLGADNGSGEWTVDVIDLAADVSAGAELRAKLDEQLTSYESAAAPMYETAADHLIDLQRRSAQIMARMIEQQQGGNAAAGIAMMTDRQALQDETGRTLDELLADIGELNRRTLDHIAAELDAEAAFQCRRSFDRAAWPAVWTDSGSLESALARAAQLDDLTSAQRESLLAIGTSYRSSYEAFCAAMTEIHRTSKGTPNGMDQDAWRDWQDERQQLARIEFDRTNLNQTTRDELLMLLDDHQVARIGGLPEVPEADGNSVFGF